MNKNIAVLFVIFCSFLSGCSINGPAMEPAVLYAKPENSIPLPASLQDTNGRTIANCETAGTSLVDGSMPDEFLRFAILTQCGRQQERDRAKFTYWQSEYIASGITLANRTCGRFLSELFRVDTGLNYSKTNLGIIATAITASLSISGDHNRAIFNTAAALTAGNAWFDNYKQNYILTPDLDILQEKINDELRKPIATAMKDKSRAGQYLNVAEAQDELVQYDRLCSMLAIKRIIKKTLEKTVVEPTPYESKIPVSSADSESAKKLIKNVFAGTVGKGNAASSGTFPPDVFQYLYVIAVPPAGFKSEDFSAVVKKSVPELTATIDAVFDPKSNVVENSAKIQAAGVLLKLDADPTIISLRDSIKNQLSNESELAAKKKVEQNFIAKNQVVPDENAQAILAINGEIAKQSKKILSFRDVTKNYDSPGGAAPISFGFNVKIKE